MKAGSPEAKAWGRKMQRLRNKKGKTSRKSQKGNKPAPATRRMARRGKQGKVLKKKEYEWGILGVLAGALLGYEGAKKL
jgi:hypothetical protein